MNNLLSLKFWFGMRPGALSDGGIKLYLYSVFLFLLISLILKLMTMRSKEKLHRRFYRKLIAFFTTNIFLLLTMFFLMYETVPFLGSRFWFLVLLIIDLVWLFYIFKFYRKIPIEKKEIKQSEEYKKYLP